MKAMILNTILSHTIIDLNLEILSEREKETEIEIKRLVETGKIFEKKIIAKKKNKTDHKCKIAAIFVCFTCKENVTR